MSVFSKAWVSVYVFFALGLPLATATTPPEAGCQLVGSATFAKLSQPDIAPSRLAAEPWLASWQPPPTEKLGPGTFWLRLVLTNATPEPTQCVLIAPTFSPLVELFAWGDDTPVSRSGWMLPLGERTIPHSQPVLPLGLPPGQSTWLIKITNPAKSYPYPEHASVAVSSLTTFYARDIKGNHLNGIYGGIMLAVVLYNFFLFLSLRERVYLLYVIFASSFSFIWLLRAGMALLFIWPNWPRWDAQASFYFICLAIIANTPFTSEFLDLRHHLPQWHRALLFLSVGAFICLLGGVLQLFGYVEKPLAFVALATSGVAISSALLRLRSGSRSAGVYLAATGTLLLGTAIYTLAFLDVLPRNELTNNAAQLGSAVEMVGLALGLGLRIKEIKDEQKRAELLFAEKREVEVAERTLTLRRALEESRNAQEAAETDRQELQRLNLYLAELSHTDPLTGLANRRKLDQALDEEWRRAFRQGSYLALLLLDVDYFKGYNDSLGHQAGDELLRTLVVLLRSCCRRPGELAARFGGDEFAILLPGVDPEGARQFAEMVRARVATSVLPHPSSPNPSSPIAAYLTISCGVASAKPVRGLNPKGLVSSADEALYTAKRSGRNRVILRFLGSGELREVDA